MKDHQLKNPTWNDPVNHPLHYIAQSGLEVIDVIEAFGLDQNFLLANVVKYILRHPLKGGVQDLKKAQWYLNRAVDRKDPKKQFEREKRELGPPSTEAVTKEQIEKLQNQYPSVSMNLKPIPSHTEEQYQNCLKDFEAIKIAITTYKKTPIEDRTYPWAAETIKEIEKAVYRND